MAKEITMPKLSDTMTEGRLVSWKKSVGERIERGDIIAEVETDKATMELEAFNSGTLLETRAMPGETAAVGTVIAIIGEGGEEPPPRREEPPEEKGRKETREKPPEKDHEAAKDEEAAAADKDLPNEGAGKEKREEKEAAGEGEKDSGVKPVRGETEKASPLVRRLAREIGIDLENVPGSGPDGRILASDLDAFTKVGKTLVELTKTDKPVRVSEESASGESRPLSRMRTAIARTVTASWQEIPHFTVTIAIGMGGAEEVRRELKESDTSVTVNDLIVKACAMALQKYPLVNNGFVGNRIKVNNDINIGLVVSLEEGLLIPVVRKCQGLSLREISGRSRELIELAISGKIREMDLSGGTFTISNMGMFGVLEFKALIYPPQGAMLAVGAVCDEAVVKNGEIVPGRIMRVTLSADHRVMDGAYAARFLQELKRVLENPVAMLI